MSPPTVNFVLVRSLLKLGHHPVFKASHGDSRQGGVVAVGEKPRVARESRRTDVDSLTDIVEHGGRPEDPEVCRSTAPPLAERPRSVISDKTVYGLGVGIQLSHEGLCVRNLEPTDVSGISRGSSVFNIGDAVVHELVIVWVIGGHSINADVVGDIQIVSRSAKPPIDMCIHDRIVKQLKYQVKPPR